MLLWAVVLCCAAGRADAPPWATGESRARDLVIRLVTFGSGEAVHQRFGHSALWVSDDGLGVERLYNYGMFTFGPNMVPQFIKGRLVFWVGEQDPEAAFAAYIDDDRSIRVQRLRLSLTSD